jgi:sugar phosphate permease
VNATRADPGRVDGAWRWVIFGACTPLFVCSQFYRVANAIVAPDLHRELGLSSEALGTLSAAFFYAFAATQIPLALALDRVGARASMALLSLVGAAGAVVFAMAEGRAAATFGEVLLGIGMAGNFMGSMKLIARWFSPREFATAAGAIGALGTLGNILATTPLALAIGAIGWRRTFVAIGVATAVLAIVFFALVRERPRAPGAPAADGTEEAIPVGAMIRRLLSSRDYWLISFGAFCRYGAFVAVQGLWAGPYLVEAAGLSPLRAANLILLLNLSFVVGAPLGGWLSDRVLSSRKKVMLAALAGTALAVLALGLASGTRSVWVIAAILTTLGVTSSFGQVVYAHVKELMPARMTGMAMTGVNFFVMLGAAAYMHGTGWVLDRWSGPAGARGPDGYRAAFVAAAAMVALALGLYSLTRDPRAGGAARARGDAPLG